MARIRRAARQASALAIRPPLEKPDGAHLGHRLAAPDGVDQREQRGHVVRVPEAVVVRRVGIGDEVAGRVVGEARVALQPVAALARAVQREDQRPRAARAVGHAQQRVQREAVGAAPLRAAAARRGAPADGRPRRSPRRAGRRRGVRARRARADSARSRARSSAYVAVRAALTASPRGSGPEAARPGRSSSSAAWPKDAGLRPWPEESARAVRSLRTSRRPIGHGRRGGSFPR